MDLFCNKLYRTTQSHILPKSPIYSNYATSLIRFEKHFRKIGANITRENNNFRKEGNKIKKKREKNHY